MACMEHECAVPGCNWATFDNTRMGPGCPKHGFENMRHHFDEADDHYEPPEERGDDDERE